MSLSTFMVSKLILIPVLCLPEKGDFFMAKIVTDPGNNNTITTKARYWTAVCYPENMRPDWKERIGEILQLPYAYCVHDKDVQGDGDDRKAHVHIMVAWPNTTTYKAALETFKGLSAPGAQCVNTCQKVQNVRYMYDYLIHDTDDARKKHKHQYARSERITGNNFDIGNYEQLGAEDKKRIRRELGQLIIDRGYTNYLDFYTDVITNFDSEYEEVCVSYSGHFERLTKGNFQKWRFEQLK